MEFLHIGYLKLGSKCLCNFTDYISMQFIICTICSHYLMLNNNIIHVLMDIKYENCESEHGSK